MFGRFVGTAKVSVVERIRFWLVKESQFYKDLSQEKRLKEFSEVAMVVISVYRRRGLLMQISLCFSRSFLVESGNNKLMSRYESRAISFERDKEEV